MPTYEDENNTMRRGPFVASYYSSGSRFAPPTQLVGYVLMVFAPRTLEVGY
jgi:hypothetical protein